MVTIQPYHKSPRRRTRTRGPLIQSARDASRGQVFREKMELPRCRACVLDSASRWVRRLFPVVFPRPFLAGTGAEGTELPVGGATGVTETKFSNPTIPELAALRTKPLAGDPQVRRRAREIPFVKLTKMTFLSLKEKFQMAKVIVKNLAQYTRPIWKSVARLAAVNKHSLEAEIAKNWPSKDICFHFKHPIFIIKRKQCRQHFPKYRKCGRCLFTRYCSRECQQKDWPIHRECCDKIREYGYPIPVRANKKP